MLNQVLLSTLAVFAYLGFNNAQMTMPDGNNHTTDSNTTAPLCVSTPWDSSCADYRYPTDLQDADNINLCTQMNFMSGCTIDKICKATSMTATSLKAKGYCDGFSVLANTCKNDMPKMGGCKNYVSMCAPTNSTVKQCTASTAIPGLPTTSTVNSAVRSICNSHTMEGCEKCTFASPTAFGNCDLLTVYSQLCVAMPNMEECGSWKTMCSQSPELHSLCGTDVMTTPPVMKMFFHSEPTHVLFPTWIPRVAGDYVWSFIVLVIMGIVVEAIQTYRPIMENRIISAKVNESHSPSNHGPIVHVYLHYVALFLVRAVEALLAYFLMLAAMSFNVVIFSAVILGLATGYIIFLPMRVRRRASGTRLDDSESSAPCC
ncbi:Ctr copper transporter family-domain-containing protein [Paraphysoderma sedebokerense]|nr:Ctr copper transporter family-domain-containing protein [Paraphysoderma sedebokerense]